MKTLRLEEMDRMDSHELTRELRRVRGQRKKLDAYENDLEIQLGKVMRDESDHKIAPPVDTDPGPRQAFIDDTKDLYKTEAERTLKASTSGG